MAFNSTLTIDGEDYAEVSQDQTGSVRIAIDSTAELPQLFVIRHNQQKAKDGSIVDRHLVQYSSTVLDTAGKVRTFVVNETFAVPRGAGFTIDQIASGLVAVHAFINPSVKTNVGTLAALLRGER